MSIMLDALALAPASANPPLGAYLLAAIPGLAAGLFAYWQSNRATRTKVDSEAYERARASYESAIRELEKSAARSAVREEKLEAALERTTRQADLLRERVAILEHLVAQLGGEIPPAARA